MKPDDQTKFEVDNLRTIADYQVSSAKRFKRLTSEMLMTGTSDSYSHLPLLVHIRSRSEAIQKTKGHHKKKNTWQPWGQLQQGERLPRMAETRSSCGRASGRVPSSWRIPRRMQLPRWYTGCVHCCRRVSYSELGMSFIPRSFNFGFLVNGPTFTVSRLSMVEFVNVVSWACSRMRLLVGCSKDPRMLVYGLIFR